MRLAGWGGGFLHRFSHFIFSIPDSAPEEERGCRETINEGPGNKRVLVWLIPVGLLGYIVLGLHV